MFPFKILRPGTEIDYEKREPIRYLVGGNGIFVQKKTSVFQATVPASGIPGLEKVEEHAEYLLPPIPVGLVGQIYQFSRRVYDLYHSEAMLIISFKPEDRSFRLDVPDQGVTPCGCDYDNIMGEPGYVIVGTAHSHGQMPAFHSGRDEDDEIYQDGIHLTFGRILEDPFEIVTTLAVSGRRFPQAVTRVLEGVVLVQSVEKTLTNDIDADEFTWNLLLTSGSDLTDLPYIPEKRSGYRIELPADMTWDDCQPSLDWMKKVNGSTRPPVEPSSRPQVSQGLIPPPFFDGGTMAMVKPRRQPAGLIIMGNTAESRPQNRKGRKK